MAERCFYNPFDSESIHDLPTSVVETRKWKANGYIDTGRGLHSHPAFWVVTVEQFVMVNESKALKHIVGDVCEEDRGDDVIKSHVAD